MSSPLNNIETMLKPRSEIRLLKTVPLQLTFAMTARSCYIIGFFWIHGVYISLWLHYVLMEGKSLETVIMTMSRNYHEGQCHVVTCAVHME